MIRKTLILLLLFTGVTAASQVNYAPSAENLKSREWFQDAKFGMFIHWGVYSTLGDGEWVMTNQRRQQTTRKLLIFNRSTQSQRVGALAKAAVMNILHNK